MEEYNGKILIVDDSFNQIKELYRQLTEHKYVVDHAQDTDEAEKMLSNSYYNAILVDLNLTTIKQDKLGLAFSEKLHKKYPNTPIICISRPSFYDTESIIKLLNPDSTHNRNSRIAFAFCDKFDPEATVDTINNLFKNELKLNYSITIINNQPKEIKEKSFLIETDNSRKIFFEEELDEIIRKLSMVNDITPNTVKISLMGSGRSRSVVIKTEMNYLFRESKINQIIKIANKNSIQNEIDNYKNNVYGFLPSNSYPYLTGSVDSMNYSAIAYSFVGEGKSQPITLRDQLNTETPIETTIDLVHKLYWDILAIPNEAEISPTSIFTAYRNRFPQIRDPEFVKSLENLFKYDKKSPLTSVNSHNELQIKQLSGTFINPIMSLHDPFQDTYQESICHGDCHGDNIVLDTNHNIFLIDFAHTKKTHALIDYVILEQNIRILASHEIDYHKFIYNEMILYNHLDLASNYNQLIKGIQETDSVYYTIINEIRCMAFSLAGKEYWKNYLQAIVYSSIALLSITSLPKKTKQYLQTTSAIAYNLLLRDLTCTTYENFTDNLPKYTSQRLLKKSIRASLNSNFSNIKHSLLTPDLLPELELLNNIFKHIYKSSTNLQQLITLFKQTPCMRVMDFENNFAFFPIVNNFSSELFNFGISKNMSIVVDEFKLKFNNITQKLQAE